MKLLELTDFTDKTKKEFVVIERIMHVQAHTEKFVHITSDEREVVIEPSFIQRLFGQKRRTEKKKIEIDRTVVDRNGSLVTLSDQFRTAVLESPEEIARLLANGSKTTEVKGV